MPTWSGAVSSNWSDTGNWIGGVLPTASTDAIFDGTFTNPCTVDGAARPCRDLITTGHNATITLDFDIQVNRHITTDAATVFAGVGYLNQRATGTWDIATGCVLPKVKFEFAVVTVTLSRSTVVGELAKRGAYNTTFTAGAAATLTVTKIEALTAGVASLIMGANVSCIIDGAASIVGGTVSITLGGSYSLSSGSTLALSNSIWFSTGATFNVSAGTMSAGTSTLVLPSGTMTLTTGSNHLWNFTSYGTVNISADLYIDNNWLHNTVIVSGAFDIYVGGNLNGGTLRTSSRKVVVSGATTGICNAAVSTGLNLYNTTLEINCATNLFACTNKIQSQSGASFGNVNYIGGIFGGTNEIFASSPMTVNMNGSSVEWAKVTANGATITLLSNVYCKDLVSSGPTSPINGVGFLVNVSRNFTASAHRGTAGIKLISATAGIAAITIDFTAPYLIIDKGAGTLSFSNDFAFSSGELIHTSGAVTAPTNLTIGTSISTAAFLTCAGIAWNSVKMNNNAALTLNERMTVASTLTELGNANYYGVEGWDTFNYTTAGQGTVSRFTSGQTYTYGGKFTSIGISSNLHVFTITDYAIFVGTANGTSLTRTSGAVPTVGMLLSQYNAPIPTGLGNLLPARPQITGGVDPNFTLDLAVSPSTGSINLLALFMCKFTGLNNGTSSQELAYNKTLGLDSSEGLTQLSFGSFNDTVGEPNPSLFLTLNWGPLVAPSQSQYSTFGD